MKFVVFYIEKAKNKVYEKSTTMRKQIIACVTFWTGINLTEDFANLKDANKSTMQRILVKQKCNNTIVFSKGGIERFLFFCAKG